MATILTRSPNAISSPTQGSPQLQHRPSKKSSFLSLRREKSSVSSIDPPLLPTSHTTARSRPNDRTMPHPPSYALEDAPKPPISRPSALKERSYSRKSSKSVSSVHDRSFSSGSRGKERQYNNGRDKRYFPEQESHAFPTIGREDSSAGATYTNARPRPRSQTGPSHKDDYDDSTIHGRQFNISLLTSTSSGLSQYEDTPQTPVDDLSFRDPVFSLPVMVAAPISGVETMDALVDGMNHRYGSDDHFMGVGGISGRSKISKAGYHPLYHPPLPTPPPGIVLGKADSRRAAPPQSRDSDEDEDAPTGPAPRWSDQQKKRRAVSSRTPSTSTVSTTSFPSRPGSSRSSDLHGSVYSGITSRTVAPSISEIIRAHAPPSQQVRSRKSSFSQSLGHETVREQPEPESDVHPTEDEAELVSRSSVDTIAEEVRRTIRNQNRSSVSPRPLHLARSFQRNSVFSDTTRTLSSPRSEGRRESSLFSYSTMSDQMTLPPLDLSGLTKPPTNSPSQTIAQYLRSARLTTLLTLTRSPHASRERPLTVSLSDLGSPNGFPLVVFLGLGCVRHIMGLYDEMAECLGVRLITIDRWGLGRTDTPRSKSARGIPEWASVVEEVLDQLHIDQCSVMAHSAGAPYALAFANRYPERIRGDVCLLAPWVGGGEGAGYKWLKYVPNGILKTAQAAEWKVQTWMIGKPPTFIFEGIGYDATASTAPEHQSTPTRTPTKSGSAGSRDSPAHLTDSVPRPSMSSGLFSEYDDLHDFEGRFDSRSTLERRSISSEHERTVTRNKQAIAKKPSRGFLGRLKSGHSSHAPSSPPDEKPSGSRGGRKLKVLRSMGSLKGRSRPSTASGHPSPTPQVPWLPPPKSTDVGLDLDKLNWSDTVRRKSLSTPATETSYPTSKNVTASLDTSIDDQHFFSRANGRRSISLGAAERSAPTSPSSMPSPVPEDEPSTPAGFQAALGNALIAASHAESSKGTHQDLIQILNHDRQPWGFSYTAYPHTVRVWYGDRDERIAENAVRWMENTMGPDKCHVKVITGADHALMYRSSVVVDVLEKICEFWHYD